MDVLKILSYRTSHNGLRQPSLQTLLLCLTDGMIRFRHQALVAGSLQPLLPMIPPFFRKPSPFFALHCLTLLRNLALELFAFAGEIPQSGRRVGKPCCCCFQRSLVGFLLAVIVLERHADGPDCVQREIIVSGESDAARLNGLDQRRRESVQVDPGGAGVMMRMIGGGF